MNSLRNELLKIHFTAPGIAGSGGGPGTNCLDIDKDNTDTETFLNSPTRFNKYHISQLYRLQKEKEKHMSYTFIKRLSDSALNDELNAAGVSEMLSEELKSALQEQIAQDRQENAKAAAREIIQVIRQSDEAITNHVLAIRELNRVIAQHKAKIEALNRARAYGSETQNFLPLAALTCKHEQLHELRQAVQTSEELFVPASFKPKNIVKVQVPKGTKKTAK